MARPPTASESTVRTQLRRTWQLSDTAIDALYQEYAAILEKGIAYRSNAEWVAREIMAAKRQATA